MIIGNGKGIKPISRCHKPQKYDRLRVMLFEKEMLVTRSSNLYNQKKKENQEKINSELSLLLPMAMPAPGPLPPHKPGATDEVQQGCFIPSGVANSNEEAEIKCSIYFVDNLYIEGG